MTWIKHASNKEIKSVNSLRKEDLKSESSEVLKSVFKIKAFPWSKAGRKQNPFSFSSLHRFS